MLSLGTWVRIRPNEWSIGYGWAGAVGVIDHAVRGTFASDYYRVTLQCGTTVGVFRETISPIQ